MTSSETTSTPRKHRVLLVDDHPIVRKGLALVINAESDLIICGEAASAAEALEIAKTANAKVAIIDISLQDRSGVELIKDFRARFPDILLLALSMHDESLYAERALRAGARGYIMKQVVTEELLTAIRRVLAGQIYVSQNMATRLLSLVTAGGNVRDESPVGALSDRELEVFTMIGRGMSTREIAEKLFLSLKTVEAHREHIKEKLKLKSWVELLRHAVQFTLNEGGPAHPHRLTALFDKIARKLPAGV